MLWSAGAAALAGAVYHGVLHDNPRASDPAWAVVGVLVVIMLTYLLAASVQDVLGPGRRRLFLAVRLSGLSAYGVLAILGRGHLTALLLCESLTMAAVLVLWLLALRRRHPRAPAMVAAILASGLAGIVFALPDEALAWTGLDGTSLSHLAQIPGMVLLFVALAGTERLVPRRSSAASRRVPGARRPNRWRRRPGGRPGLSAGRPRA